MVGTIPEKHLARLLQAQLPLIIYTLLGELGQIGDRLGIGVYAVGGFVRDLLLHKDNLDIDIVIEGDGIEFAREIEKVMECRVRLHERFGTAVVVFPDGFKLDIASTRTEYYLEPGALPNVEHASIKLDLYRRDFTINTMAVALNVDVFGDLFDFFKRKKICKMARFGCCIISALLRTRPVFSGRFDLNRGCTLTSASILKRFSIVPFGWDLSKNRWNSGL